MSITEISNGCTLVNQTLCVRDIFPMEVIEDLATEMESVKGDDQRIYYELSAVIRYNRRPEYEVKNVEKIPIGELRHICGLNIQRVSQNLCISVA